MKSDEPKVILQKAANLLQQPGRFAKKADARNAAGNPVAMTARDAASFSIVAAIHAFSNDHKAAMTALDLVIANLPPGKNVVSYNDDQETTAADAVELLKKSYLSAKG